MVLSCKACTTEQKLTIKACTMKLTCKATMVLTCKVCTTVLELLNNAASTMTPKILTYKAREIIPICKVCTMYNEADMQGYNGNDLQGLYNGTEADYAGVYNETDWQSYKGTDLQVCTTVLTCKVCTTVQCTDLQGL